MTTKKPEEPADDESRGMLDDAASLDTTSLGILTHTAQINVILPQTVDDDLDDDAVVEGEVADGDLDDAVLEPARALSVAAADPVADENVDADDVEADDGDDGAVDDAPAAVDDESSNGEVEIDEIEIDEVEIEAIVVDAADVSVDASADAADEVSDADEDAQGGSDAVLESIVIELPADEADSLMGEELVDTAEDEVSDDSSDADIAEPEPEPDLVHAAPETVAAAPEVVDTAAEPVAAEPIAAEPDEAEPGSVTAEPERVVAAAAPVAALAPVAKPEPIVEPDSVAPKSEPVAEPEPVASEPMPVAEPEPEPEPVAPEPEPVAEPEPGAAPSTPVTSPIRIRSRQSQTATSRTPRADAVKEKTTATQPTRAEATPTSRRIDDIGDASRESADLLTADRLLDPSRLTKPEPEGAWSHFLYTLSGHRINIGDGRRARERKALTARIAAPLPGGAKFVPVLSRKGGVGKTAITALLGMALADAREDRVIAVDANPDRGTLADRVARGHHTKSIRDLARIHDEVRGYHDISAIVARDATRLDVLASDSDPRIAEAFSDLDYRDVAEVAAHYYSLVLTDTGTGIVHSVMAAALGLADQMVIVSGLSVDEARLASETLTWLETNGFAEQAHDAIVVLNQSTPGTPLVRLNELESHFATRARKVVRMPYDAQIAGGGTIEFAGLQPETRIAARELAALLVEGLRVKVA